jgi:tripartite-type tricarboxylate transporter receptor subunit TctC
MPDYEANNWYGLLAPAGLPKPIAETIYADTAKALQLQDLKDRLSAVGMVAKAMTPENFGLYIKSEIVKWAKVVRASGAKPD